MFFVFVVLTTILNVCNGQVFYQPEQVHLSMTNDPTEMMITWVTLDKTNASIVEYGEGLQIGFTLKAVGQETAFVDGGSEKRKLYMHRVLLQGLTPGQRYVYHVGSMLGWSDIFYFNATKEGNDWPLSFVVVGDMGNVNAASLPYLQRDIQNNQMDFLYHIGDFAYNMDSDNARVGDEFMRQVEPIAAYVPYMTCVGNHEYSYNFSNYKARFTMPGGDGQSQYFSFNVGPVHFISISTEFYYYVDYGWKQIENQYNWLVKDLQDANKPEQRALRPWIVVVGHRPMYCSNSDEPLHCPNVDNLVRVGIKIPNTKVYMFGFEPLFYEQGVDLIFGAHEHSYERMWPVYNRIVCNGTDDSKNPYSNPPAPVHFVSGSGGCQEGHEPFFKKPMPWSAFRSEDYGYTTLKVFNSTHMSIDQIAVSGAHKGQIIDSIMYVRHKHGPGMYTCHSSSEEKMP